ncbi:MAG TPA: phosphate-binding protein, partial [Spirochaetota bacterium]|nr:phosphate-binding protein [Spirochaetota bacterium]
MKKVLLLALSGLILSTGLFSQNVSVDGAIPSYSKKSGISGSLNSIGSDSLINLMAFWSEGFKKNYPGVKFQIEGNGSSTAPPALIAGSAQFG